MIPRLTLAPTANRPGIRSACASEAGITLIEALLALVLSIVVGLAVFSMMEFSFRQTYNVAERVNANQRGRTTLERILLRLHSSCVAVSAVPVREKSNGVTLNILSKEGNQAYFGSMTEHSIYLSGTTLFDATYNSNPGGVAPNWTFPSTPTSVSTLLTNVSPPSGSTSIFQYSKYENGSLVPITATESMSKTVANSVAWVKITLLVAPETTTRSGGPTRSVELTSSTLLRFDPASSTGQNTPCT